MSLLHFQDWYAFGLVVLFLLFRLTAHQELEFIFDLPLEIYFWLWLFIWFRHLLLFRFFLAWIAWIFC